MRGGWRTIATIGLGLGSLLGASAASGQPAADPGSGRPVATVGDDVITLEEVEQALAVKLAELERQRYTLLNERLQQLIGERLLAREAERRSVSVDELLREEVYDKVREVSDGEVTAFITQNRARLPEGREESELRQMVSTYLRTQRVERQRLAYLGTLRAQTRVTVWLPEPAVQRAVVSPDKGFVRGPAEAPVTIVEFSDFQCPFCKRVIGTVQQVVEQYPGKVKWVFRDFPIVSLHPTAPKAHEAARCAGAQGKFWEYHDLLFERSPRHAPEQLKQYARELSLESSGFDECLDSGTYQAAVAGDVEEGTRLGVSGTPTFFINGRVLVGAQPVAAFQQLIESELAAKAQ